MLTIEEYIEKRKKEDGLNEFDTEKRAENTKLCIDYVFEYFNNYLNITKAEEKNILHNEKLEKFRKQFEAYDVEISNWIVDIFDQYGKHIHRQIGNIARGDLFFFLYNTEAEFRGASYECYSTLIKKLPFLKQHSEMIYLFIKEYHRVQSEMGEEFSHMDFYPGMQEWLEQTWKKHHVNVYKFVSEWIEYFSENEGAWPKSHKKKSNSSFREYEYDYTKESNLFNIDSLYRKIPKKAFIKGRKQELEILMMYYWLTYIEGDDDGYWSKYLNRVIELQFGKHKK